MAFTKLFWQSVEPLPVNEDWSLGIDWDEPYQHGGVTEGSSHLTDGALILTAWTFAARLPTA